MRMSSPGTNGLPPWWLHQAARAFFVYEGGSSALHIGFVPDSRESPAKHESLQVGALSVGSWGTVPTEG